MRIVKINKARLRNIILLQCTEVDIFLTSKCCSKASIHHLKYLSVTLSYDHAYCFIRYLNNNRLSILNIDALQDCSHSLKTL